MMEDKTVLGRNPFSEKSRKLRDADSSEEDYGYVDSLIREVCLKGDSLDKYAPILMKKYSDGTVYEGCYRFVKTFLRIRNTGSITEDDGLILREMADRIHLSKDTYETIESFLDTSSSKGGFSDLLSDVASLKQEGLYKKAYLLCIDYLESNPRNGEILKEKNDLLQKVLAKARADRLFQWIAAITMTVVSGVALFAFMLFCI
jgi:hypothetical protein